ARWLGMEHPADIGGRNGGDRGGTVLRIWHEKGFLMNAGIGSRIACECKIVYAKGDVVGFLRLWIDVLHGFTAERWLARASNRRRSGIIAVLSYGRGISACPAFAFEVLLPKSTPGREHYDHFYG
ncbi:MAG: hypothetical protein AAFR72_11885, partial [Pseudomonadota bacterium]